MAKNTPGVQICTRGANLNPGANCAHERGLTLHTDFYNVCPVCDPHEHSSAGKGMIVLNIPPLKRSHTVPARTLLAVAKS